MDKSILVFGTRPELIKLTPVIWEFEKRGLRNSLIIVNSGQHKDILPKYLKKFFITPDFELDMLLPGGDLCASLAQGLNGLSTLVNNLIEKGEKIRRIIAQGDTTTVLASAMVAFFHKFEFAHVEAGLRSFDLENPFPEEYNRKIVSSSTSVHFAPTIDAKINLLKEGIEPKRIVITGNTVVDALEAMRDITLSTHQNNLVLITCHRRENQNDNLKNLLNTVKTLALKYPELEFLWVLHPNPSVRNVVLESGIDKIRNIKLSEPIEYLELLGLYNKIRLIITDSGGIQEEAPSFNIPVLIAREKTERIESLKYGYSFLVGTNEKKILKYFNKLIKKRFKFYQNPYGDGKAAERIVDYLTGKKIVKEFHALEPLTSSVIDFFTHNLQSFKQLKLNETGKKILKAVGI